MWSLRAAVVIGVTAWMSARMTTCRSPGEGGAEPSPAAKRETADVSLPQVDTSALTTREKSEWSSYVSEFLTPCPDQPVSLAQCVQQSRPCKACLPAARFLLDLARRGQVRSQVELVYKARFSPEAVKDLSLADAPSKGPADAKVVLAEFADFQCPACGAARPVIEEALKRHPRDLRVVFKHFPLSMHENAEKSARAAVAAMKQNKFWEMHAVLFENQQKLDSESVEGLAKGIGLDMKRFVQDRDSEATADVVARDRKQGEALALKSTPSIFINGRPLMIVSDLPEDLELWIQSELELGGAPPASAPSPAAPAPAPSASGAPAEPAAAASAHPGAKPAPSAKPSSVGAKPAASASPSHS
jgi:protein-disulfide isomerase